MKCAFVCVSKAYHTKDEREPIEGILNLANVAHRHGFPVTWIITDRACDMLADELAQWHKDFGDEVAMALVRIPIDADAYHKRREAMRRACPWSNVSVAGGGGGKSARMIEALETAGFEGLWGYCWEQVYVDGISDYGQPPGMFMASKNSYKMPSPDGSGVVALEWLSRDLNKAFWTANPVNYACEPDAMIVMGDWPWDVSQRYVAHLLEEYIRNAKAGQPIPFMFQEEAAQLMPGLINERYDRAWDKILGWIDDFLGSIDPVNINKTTATQLATELKANPRSVQLVRARDMRCPKLKRDGLPVWGAEWEYPEVAHYSDALRFCTFVVGNPAPIRIIRYDRQGEVSVADALTPEPDPPRLLGFHKCGDDWRARIRSDEDMPYALAVTVEDGEDAPDPAVVNGDLAVWPIDVLKGEHEYLLGDASDGN